MLTQCKPLSFAFQGCQGRKVTAAFDGGSITSNAGALLLGKIDQALGFFDRVAAWGSGAETWSATTSGSGRRWVNDTQPAPGGLRSTYASTCGRPRGWPMTERTRFSSGRGWSGRPGPGRRPSAPNNNVPANNRSRG